MPDFNEDLLQFIWRHRLLKPHPLVSKAGNEITVVKQGDLNTDSGPDFFNSQIRVNDLLLAGNIEIHIHTSDWLKHKHQQDKSYDNIILHVVYEHDVDLKQNADNNVEVLEIKELIDDRTLSVYRQLAGSPEKLACNGQLPSVSDLTFTSWMERMTIERLETKVAQIESLFVNYGGDYTQTFYTLLFRNFGFKVNSLPFELLSKHLPVHLLLKHAEDLLQLEALLLGMAGLLQDQYADKYIQKLQNEFEYLTQKYKLVPLQKEIFKFSKLRPSNFPTIRLAQFAKLLHTNTAVFVNPQKLITFPAIKEALKIQLEGYWLHHYNMEGEEIERSLNLGEESKENVMINSFAPFYFFYGKKLNKPEYVQAAIALLNSCKAENNVKTRMFAGKKHLLQNAACSQGLIHLYDNYCTSKKCLKCGVAAAIMFPAD